MSDLRGPAPGRLAGLLLDIGGVVHSTAMHLVGRLAETEPAMQPVINRIGGIATDRTNWRDEIAAPELEHRVAAASRPRVRCRGRRAGTPGHDPPGCTSCPGTTGYGPRWWT